MTDFYLSGSDDDFMTIRPNESWRLSDEVLEEGNYTFDLTDLVNGKPVTAYHYSIETEHWTPATEQEYGPFNDPTTDESWEVGSINYLAETEGLTSFWMRSEATSLKHGFEDQRGG